MSGGNPSTIWAQLTTPSPSSGAIPYVNSDNVTIVVNPANFWFNPIAYQLSVSTNGDQTGTDSVNTYFQQDSYYPYNAAITSGLGANGTTAGHTVSSSRGTGLAPQNSVNGDFIGKFSGWCWTGYAPTIPTWTEIAGINIYAAGNVSSIVGIGGEMRFFTKQDNGIEMEWIRVSNTGRLSPIGASAATVVLGDPQTVPASEIVAATGSWQGLHLSYFLAQTAGAKTANCPVGKVKIAGGSSSVVVTNSLVSANSIIQGQLETVDATALYIKAITPGAGSFTITMNANATGTIIVNWFVLQTDT